MIKNPIILWLWLLCNLCYADLSVTVKTAVMVETITPHITTQMQTTDGYALGSPTETIGEIEVREGQAVALIFIESGRDLADTANVLVKVRSKTTEVKSIDTGVYAVDTPGTHLINIVVLAQNPLSWDEAEVTVEVGEVEPPPSPIPNDYEVGVTAYNLAPSGDVDNAKLAAKIYEDAGNFLYGIPSLKFITSANEVHNSDPNRSIMAWIGVQYASLPSSWTEWKNGVREALIASQKKRPYSRQDWYNAFQEISRGVGEKAK